MQKVKKAVRTARDYVAAHRKAIIAGAALLSVQEVDSETVDWVVSVLGVALTLLTPNDAAAKFRIYKK